MRTKNDIGANVPLKCHQSAQNYVIIERGGLLSRGLMSGWPFDCIPCPQTPVQARAARARHVSGLSPPSQMKIPCAANDYQAQTVWLSVLLLQWRLDMPVTLRGIWQSELQESSTVYFMTLTDMDVLSVITLSGVYINRSQCHCRQAFSNVMFDSCESIAVITLRTHNFFRSAYQSCDKGET